MTAAVRNVIFDLGGVVFEWNPDHIVARVQPVPELRASLKAALFGHADWRLFDRGALTEPELIERLQVRIGATRQEVEVILDAVRHSLVEKPETLQLIRALQAQGTPLFLYIIGGALLAGVLYGAVNNSSGPSHSVSP